MEIVFSVIVFALLVSAIVGIVVALRRRNPRPIVVTIFVLLVAEIGIWFGVPQFPRRMATATKTNIAQTSPNPEFPELRTRVYPAAPGQVLEAATAAIAARPGKWAVVSSDPASGKLHATTEVLMFTDDVFLTATPENASTLVNVRSQSRVGKGDFGENRRHVAWLLENLDLKLAPNGNTPSR